jgi:excisionase family DNA binding protein
MGEIQKVPRLLRIKEVAEKTGLARWRLYELIGRGEGPPHMRVGKTIRVSEAALVRWIEEQHGARAGTP